MAHERNVHRMVVSAPAISTGKRARRTAVTRSRGGDRRFDALDPESPVPQELARTPWLVIPLVVAALLVVAFARSLIVRTLLPLALATAAVFVLAQRSR